MGTTWTLFRRECKSYFHSPMAYTFILIFLLVNGIVFFDVGNFLAENLADMRTFFAFVPWMLLVFTPAIAMRLWAEERKTGSVELLMTLPVRDLEAVLAKFFASLLILFLALALTFPIPWIVARLADPNTGVDWGPIVGGYIGVFFMGAAYLAIGLFISSLTSNQILAFIGGVVVCFALFLIGLPPVLSRLPAALVPALSYIGFGSHMNNISRGMLDSRDFVYFLSVIALFLFLTVRSVERRMGR